MKRSIIFAAGLVVCIAFFSLPVAEVDALTDTVRKIFQSCDPDQVQTTSKPPTCEGKTNTQNPVTNVINIAASIIALVTGIAAVVTIIIGGYYYITAGGNTERVTKGKSMIIYSIVAVAIVAMAWVLVSFVIDTFIQ